MVSSLTPTMIPVKPSLLAVVFSSTKSPDPELALISRQAPTLPGFALSTPPEPPDPPDPPDRATAPPVSGRESLWMIDRDGGVSSTWIESLVFVSSAFSASSFGNCITDGNRQSRRSISIDLGRTIIQEISFIWAWPIYVLSREAICSTTLFGPTSFKILKPNYMVNESSLNERHILTGKTPSSLNLVRPMSGKLIIFFVTSNRHKNRNGRGLHLRFVSTSVQEMVGYLSIGLKLMQSSRRFPPTWERSWPLSSMERILKNNATSFALTESRAHRYAPPPLKSKSLLVSDSWIARVLSRSICDHPLQGVCVSALMAQLGNLKTTQKLSVFVWQSFSGWMAPLQWVAYRLFGWHIVVTNFKSWPIFALRLVVSTSSHVERIFSLNMVVLLTPPSLLVDKFFTGAVRAISAAFDNIPWSGDAVELKMFSFTGALVLDSLSFDWCILTAVGVQDFAPPPSATKPPFVLGFARVLSRPTSVLPLQGLSVSAFMAQVRTFKIQRILLYFVWYCLSRRTTVSHRFALHHFEWHIPAARSALSRVFTLIIVEYISSLILSLWLLLYFRFVRVMWIARIALTRVSIFPCKCFGSHMSFPRGEPLNR